MPRSPENSFDGIIFYGPMDGYLKKLCNTGLQPNLISLLGLPISYLIFINMINKKKWNVLLLLILRQYFDSLDGELARQCNKRSDIGGKLDMWIDLIFSIIFVYGFIVSIYKEYYTLNTFILVSIILYIFFEINTDFDTHEMKNKIGIWHEQNVTISLFIFWLIWIYCAKI